MDWIVEDEYRRAFESLWDEFPEENPSRVTAGGGGYKGDIINQSFGKDCSQVGECVLHGNRVVLVVLIGEDENGAERFDVPLNKSYDTLLMGLVILDMAGGTQLRRVEDTNLVKRSCLLTSLRIQALTNVPLTLIIS